MVDAALISGLLSNLAPLIKDEFSLFWSFRKEVQKLSSTLSSINAVLEDAERKNVREKDKQTEDWLGKLKDVVYEVRDIMGECSFKDLKLQVKRLNASSSTRIQVTNSITRPFSSTLTRLKIGHKIKDVQEKLDQISSERKKLHLRESNHNHDSKTETLNASWRETMSLSECSLVYGRDSEKQQIVDILVNRSSEAAEKLSVLPIVGIGGLGKTTLAQMVFNDHEVAKHFDPKIWVCVSNEFDIKLVIKAIITTTNETSLEELQKKVRNLLNGKRYLIVLDDVWNENIEKWDKLRSILDCGSNGAFVLTTTRKRSVAEIMETIQHFNLSSLPEDDCWLLFKERAFKHGAPKSPNFFDIGKDIARKCKGVPLVAKTLGSRLRFKNDENEWYRIRDNEIWEISDENSILPILKLSYYDLPYYLRRCFAFCAIFPKNTEIEKKMLIQLWMAHDLIPPNKNQELEDNGNIIWDELCWRSFFQEEKLNLKGVQTCKMHDLMHDLTQYVMKDNCYTMDDKSSSKNFGREIRHITIMAEKCKELSFASLKNKGGVQSIVVPYSIYIIKGLKETFSGGNEFSSLRVFEVPKQILEWHYMGSLKHLRYLNISHNVMIKTLPDSICGFLNLQTLKLNYCYNLKSLPRNTKDLINLRHLYLEGCQSLNGMPKGMRQLKHLRTLSLFVIGDKPNCQLDELQELDLRGSLEISNLDSVSDASIARGISLSKMININKLQLHWKNDTNNGDEKKTRHEKIGEALEVSTTCLKRLKINSYKGVKIPKWMAESSASLMHLRLERMDNVQHIFTMNTSCEIRMPVAFPLLEELCIEYMKNLRELVSPTPIPITTTGAFPNLRKIQIINCPKLGALPLHLKSLKDVCIQGECSDELLHSILNQSGLNDLDLRYMDERSVLFLAANNNNDEELMLDDDDEITSSTLAVADNNEAQAGGRSAFQSLRRLCIINCKKLRCLFDQEECEELAAGGSRGERERTRGLTNLDTLHIVLCPELMITVEQWRNLITHSLQDLWIWGCPKLVPSKVEEAEEVIALLRSLRARPGFRRFDVDFLRN